MSQAEDGIRCFCLSRGIGDLCKRQSVILAWLDLLRMESSRSKARRGAAWMWLKVGWPAQHVERVRREVSRVEITKGCLLYKFEPADDLTFLVLFLRALFYIVTCTSTHLSVSTFVLLYDPTLR